MVLTLTYGEQSRQNAFTIWKENTVLKSYVQKQKALVARYKEETETEHSITRQLEEEIAQVEFDTKMNEKEFKREQVWYETKLKKVTLDSNTSKHRTKAISIVMNVLLNKQKRRQQVRCFNRLYEHKMLHQIKEQYKRDMIAN